MMFFKFDRDVLAITVLQRGKVFFRDCCPLIVMCKYGCARETRGCWTGGSKGVVKGLKDF